jgi:hypothetical protein
MILSSYYNLSTLKGMVVVTYVFIKGFLQEFLFHKVFVGSSKLGNDQSRTFSLVQGMPNTLFIFRSCSRSENGLLYFDYLHGFVTPKSEHTVFSF